ncbi:MAG: AbrB/MazE/SpoVT family DNA-binding domain-containing protein [Candidatus Thermoplasmatota archaeon]|nr:AbrB/MazE/SpoVT family DNA-binding domain-containing protein [Candidatus Thermoplasmatota archaeon]
MIEDALIGSTKVGARGQIVLPIDIRKQCGIEPGDTMIAMARKGPNGWSVMLIRASSLAPMLGHLQETERKIRSIIDGNQKKVSSGKKA